MPTKTNTKKISMDRIFKVLAHTFSTIHQEKNINEIFKELI